MKGCDYAPLFLFKTTLIKSHEIKNLLINPLWKFFPFYKFTWTNERSSTWLCSGRTIYERKTFNHAILYNSRSSLVSKRELLLV